MTPNHHTIITCPVTGSADTVQKNPAVPVTPAEIAASAIDAAKAGAAAVHIHVRDPDTGAPSMDLELYRDVVERIRASSTDVVINLTTGPGHRFKPSPENPRMPGPGTTVTWPMERVRHVVELQPELCSLDVATMNMGSAFGEVVMMNLPSQLMAMADAIREAGTKPELEVFDSGHALLANYLIEQGHVERPPFFQLCLGVQWGAPATASAIRFLTELLPSDAYWAAFGVGREQFPMVAEAVRLGGHVRVGLEDNLYVEKGVLAPSNAALVEKAVKIVEQEGGTVATAAEARTILGVESHRRSSSEHIVGP